MPQLTVKDEITTANNHQIMVFLRSASQCFSVDKFVRKFNND